MLTVLVCIEHNKSEWINVVATQLNILRLLPCRWGVGKLESRYTSDTWPFACIMVSPRPSWPSNHSQATPHPRLFLEKEYD